MHDKAAIARQAAIWERDTVRNSIAHGHWLTCKGLDVERASRREQARLTGQVVILDRWQGEAGWCAHCLRPRMRRRGGRWPQIARWPRPACVQSACTAVDSVEGPAGTSPCLLSCGLTLHRAAPAGLVGASFAIRICDDRAAR